jgi:hypothetical protein
MSPRPLALLLACGLLAGCGGGGSASHATSAETAAAAQSSPSAELERAVRVALEQNEKVSGYVLWHNALPSNAAQSTGGPALAGLRGSARQRKAQHVRVRTISSALKVRSIQLDPSYLSATASDVSESRVRVYKHGRPIGHAIALKEPSQITLHRVGSKTQFVVWKVAVVK